ncbi:MAG: phage holin family protein [Phycisphaerales bacterium]
MTALVHDYTRVVQDALASTWSLWQERQPWGPIGTVLVGWYGMITQRHWELLVIALCAMALDYLTGVYSAWHRRAFDRDLLWRGIWAKMARGLVVPIGLLLDRLTALLMPGEQLPGAIESLLPWMTFGLAVLGVSETISALDNIRAAEGKDSAVDAMLVAAKRLLAGLVPRVDPPDPPDPPAS